MYRRLPPPTLAAEVDDLILQQYVKCYLQQYVKCYLQQYVMNVACICQFLFCFRSRSVHNMLLRTFFWSLVLAEILDTWRYYYLYIMCYQRIGKLYFNILWDCPKEGSSIPDSEAYSIVARELEQTTRVMQSLYLPLLPDWLIRLIWKLFFTHNTRI